LEDEVREQMSHRSTRGVRKGIRGGVNSDHEGVRSRARYMERIPTVTCSGVDHRAGERARELA